MKKKNMDHITRAEALAALDEPEAGKAALAKELGRQMEMFAGRLGGGKKVKITVRNDFEEVAAETLVRLIVENAEMEGETPPVITISRVERGGG